MTKLDFGGRFLAIEMLYHGQHEQGLRARLCMVALPVADRLFRQAHPGGEFAERQVERVARAPDAAAERVAVGAGRAEGDRVVVAGLRHDGLRFLQRNLKDGEAGWLPQLRRAPPQRPGASRLTAAISAAPA